MKNSASLRSIFVIIISLVICGLGRAQGRYVDILLSDVQGQPMSGVRLGVKGSGSAVTDRLGSAHLPLNQQAESNVEVELYIVTSPEKLVFISPWDARVRVPRFTSDSQNSVRIVVAARGDRRMLKQPAALVAMVSRIVKTSFLISNESGKNAPTSTYKRQRALLETGRVFGLGSKEIDKAIRDWGEKSGDPFEIGLAALYAQDYSKASTRLMQSSRQTESELTRMRADLSEAAVSLGRYQYDQGKYRDSVESFRQALQLDPNDPAILKWLGKALAKANELDEAESIYKRLLAVAEKAYGTRHSKYASALSDLAQLAALKGDFKNAETLYLEVAEIKSVQGSEDPELANALNNLGLLYRSMGDEDRAQKFFERALEAFERILGPYDQHVATSLNNLASVYYARGQYAEAETLFKRALSIFERLGPEYPGMTASLNNLAAVYYAKGDYRSALELFQRVLAISEKTYGPKHRDVAKALNNLANVYSSLGEGRKALDYYQQALPLWRTHADRFAEALTLYDIGLVYSQINENQKALDYYLRALPLLRGVGDLNGTANTLENIGLVYSSLSQKEKALEYSQQALLLHRAVGDRSGEASALNNIGLLYVSLGKYEEAEELYKEAIAISEKTHGNSESLTASMLANLAALYRDQGKYSQAVPLYLRVIGIREKALGTDHLDVAASLIHLAETYRGQGKHGEARPLLERALVILERASVKEDPRTAALRAELASKSFVTITDPVEGFVKVGRGMVVRGTITNLPNDEHLWVLVHRKDSDEWWPQGEARIDSESGTWEASVVFGGPEDVGNEFEIAIITLNAQEHLRLKERVETSALMGWLPIKMPTTTSLPYIRRVRKDRND